MRNFSKTLFVLLLLLRVEMAHAGPSSYQCEIKEAWVVGPEGKLEPYPLERRGVTVVETYFAVDRTTGVIIGGPLATREYTKTEVLDRGGHGTYFKLLLNIGDGHNFSLLFVEEFADSPDKAFYANDNSLLYNGLCR